MTRLFARVSSKVENVLRIGLASGAHNDELAQTLSIWSVSSQSVNG
jgi:hypothetical protein